MVVQVDANCRCGEEDDLYYSDLITHPKNKLWVRSSDI